MTEVVKSEIDVLKEQLTERGIKFKANATKASLEKLLAKAEEQEIKEEENQELEKQQDDALKLVCVIVTPNDPIKQQMGQEYFACGNSMVGTVARIIPFGERWLVENILVNAIREKQYQMFITKRNTKGEEYVETKLVPAYQVTELPLPTKEELEELARNQNARNAVDV